MNTLANMEVTSNNLWYSVGPQLCLPTFARSKRGTTVHKSTYTDLILFWVSDVTFVTFFGDKQCHASHLSHFWQECDALPHENIFFNLWRFLSHPSRKKVTFWHRRYKTFWTGRNVTIRLGMKHVFLFPSQIFSIISEAWSGKAIWAKTDPYSQP